MSVRVGIKSRLLAGLALPVMAAAVLFYAEAAGAQGVPPGAQGGASTLPVPAGGGVDRQAQPAATALGQLAGDPVSGNASQVGKNPVPSNAPKQCASPPCPCPPNDPHCR